MSLFSTLKQIPAAVLPASFLAANTTEGCVVLAGVALDQLSTALLVHVGRLPVYRLEYQPEVTKSTSKTNDSMIHPAVDLNDADAVAGFFKQLEKAGKHVELLIVQGAVPVQQTTADLQSSDLQQRWQSTGLAAVAVAQAGIKHMLANRQGAVIFLGSAYAANPVSGWLADAAVQAAVRALSQSLAREFQPKGIHVTYLALTEWSSHSEAAAQAIASTCWHVYQQPQSTWSQELSA